MKSHTLSLLPWLQPVNTGVGLTLTPKNAVGEEAEFSFCVLSESSTLAQTLRAALTLPDGDLLNPVWLLAQKDHYPVPNDSYGKLTNAQIDNRWNNARQVLKAANGHVIDLNPPQSPGDRLPRYQSLFYCKTRTVYFHPPCPVCGQPLALCTSDEVLKQKGLAPYSHSLNRYLYCVACGEQSDFYVDERDALEPLWIKNCRELLQKWSDAVLAGTAKVALPCCTCEQRASCHDDNKHYLTRLLPFRFFDFYLLAFSAYDLSLSAFAALVSGARVSELLETSEFQSDRGQSALLHLFVERYPEDSSFFFAGSSRAFLEVLYLKLCLIRQVFRHLMCLNTGEAQNLFYSPAQFWVKLHGGDNRLPWLWNFEVEPLDLVYWPAQDNAGVGAALCDSDLWSKVWFGLLVKNARQSFFDVCCHLPDIKQQLIADNGFFSGAGPLPECITAENIFWSQPGTQPDAAGSALWRKTLEIGGTLLTAGSEFGAEKLIIQLDALLTAIKTALFEAPQTHSSVKPQEGTTEDAVENADIARLLKGLFLKWQTQNLMRQEEPATTAAPEALTAERPFAFDPEPDSEEMDLDKTTVIDAGTMNFAALNAREEVSLQAQTSAAETHDFDATVVLDPAQLKTMFGSTHAPPKAVEAGPEPAGDDFDMNETVIISKEELARQLGTQKK